MRWVRTHLKTRILLQAALTVRSGSFARQRIGRYASSRELPNRTRQAQLS